MVVHFEFGVWGAQMASLISTIIVVLVSFFSYTRLIYTYQFSFAWAKKMLRFGYPLIWAGMAVWIYSVSDRFFILHYRSTLEIGLYSIGNTFSQPIGLLNMAIQMSFGVLFWDIYHKEKEENKKESKKMMSEVVVVYVSIAIIALLFLSIFSYEFVGFFTTPEYLGGIIVIPILLSSKIYSQMVQIIPVGISISEKTWHYTWIIIVVALINLGLNFLIIPRYGFFGAAITTLIAYIVYYALSDLVSMRFFNARYPRLRINIMLFLAIGLALFFPINEIYYNLHYGIGIKILVFVLGGSLPIIFSLIKISQIRSLLFKLISKN